MSEKEQTEDEPSIEEILDSIRQIISEDEEMEEEENAASPAEESSPEETKPVAKPEPAPEPAPTEEEPLDQSAIDDIDFDTPGEESTPEPEAEKDDVFELTELVNSEENTLDIDLLELDEPEPVPESEPEPEPVPEPEPEPEPVPEPEPEPEPEPVEEDPLGGDDSILTNTAEAAALTAISNLVRKTAIGHGGVTLEDIVRAELKPLLRDWLDKHLPTVIERLVKEELERVSKRVLDE